MFTSVLLLSAILAPAVQGIYPKTCPENDCMPYESCPEAVDRALNDKSEATTKLFQKAYCGKVNKSVRVCCSDFQPTKVTFGIRAMVPDEDMSPKPDGVTDNSITNTHLLPSSCGDIYEPRIVGGKNALMYEFPWMALISYETDTGREFQCAGSIINSRYILTAAHCVEGKHIAGVRVGEYDLRYMHDCQGNVCEKHLQDIPVEYWVCHKKYVGYPHYEYDIALIRLEADIDFNHRNVQPICLPISKELRDRSITNKQATVAGWGLTELEKESSILLKVIIPVPPNDVCQSYYGFMTDESTQFCAGAFKKDSCRGDSGGPLMIEGTYNGIQKFIQYGIVSNGPSSCGTQSPGLYTDVRKYMDWILNNIKER